MQVSSQTVRISWCFFLYFAVLFAERARSILLIAKDGSSSLFSFGFDGFVNFITVLSLLATVVLLTVFNGGFWFSLFGKGDGVNYYMLTITACTLLLSGMVHTEYTVAPLQFGAYGALILAMILQTVTNAKSAEHPALIWYGIVFLTVFSMAIPVMYKADIEKSSVFYVIEAVTAAALVISFTYLMRRVFLYGGTDLMLWVPMLIALVGDALIIAMRWQEKPNTFVLIFIIASTLLFSVGKVLEKVIK